MDIYASELGITLNMMARRRGGANRVTNIESVAMAMRLSNGLADGTVLVPAAANTFYYASFLQTYVTAAQTGAGIYLSLTNLGGGSAGGQDYITQLGLGTVIDLSAIEFESIAYRANGNTAGTVLLHGTVYKITL